MDALGRAQGKAPGDPTPQEGGASPTDRTTETAQQGRQGAYETSIRSPDLSGQKLSYFCWLPTDKTWDVQLIL